MLLSRPRGGGPSPAPVGPGAHPLGERGMTRTRWKLMAGGLMIALGGLAAVAGAQSQCGAPSHMVPPRPVAVVYGDDCNGQYVQARAPVGVVGVAQQPPADLPTPM